MANIMTHSTGTMMSNPDEVRALFSVTDADLAALKQLGERVTPKMDEFVKAFYTWLRTLPEFDVYFPDQRMVDHVEELQRAYWLEVFAAEIDQAYFNRRLTVGETHARIGLPLGIYFSAMNRATILFTGELYDGSLDAETYAASVLALNKVSSMDTALVVDTYARISNEAAATEKT